MGSIMANNILSSSIQSISIHIHPMGVFLFFQSATWKTRLPIKIGNCSKSPVSWDCHHPPPPHFQPIPAAILTFHNLSRKLPGWTNTILKNMFFKSSQDSQSLQSNIQTQTKICQCFFHSLALVPMKLWNAWRTERGLGTVVDYGKFLVHRIFRYTARLCKVKSKRYNMYIFYHWDAKETK